VQRNSAPLDCHARAWQQDAGASQGCARVSYITTRFSFALEQWTMRLFNMRNVRLPPSLEKATSAASHSQLTVMQYRSALCIFVLAGGQG
jgi:hypothetical protein